MIDYSLLPGKKRKNIGNYVNKENVIISIVTPFYNGGETLEETANCILNQTYPYFEWIIVDDGSKDKKSLKELDRIEKFDNRIKVYHKENAGPSQARDFGISKAAKSSKYIFFIDCDDQMENNMLDVLYWSLETHPECSFAYTAMTNFGHQEFIWNKYLTGKLEKKENLICICSLVRKDDLLEVGCFGIKEKSMYEDWNLWLKLMGAGKKPLRINAPLFWYRTSNTGELSRAQNNHENAMKYVNESAKKVSDTAEVVQFPFAGDKILNNKNFNIEYNMTLPQYENSNKTTILMIVPWMVIGGADLFNLELIKRANKEKYRFILVSTLPKENALRQEFYENCEEVYDLSTFLARKDYHLFIKYLIESRKVDILFNTNSTYGYAMLPYIKSQFPKLKIIDYVHSVDLKDENGGFGKYTEDFDEIINKTYTCNNFTTNQLKTMFSKNNVETLYIGVDEKRYDSKRFDKNKVREEYGINVNSLVISFIARLSEEKRPELFVKIANELLKNNESLEFVIAGDGPLREDTKQIIKKLGQSSKIHMLGMVSKTEEVYAMSDLTINCSSLEGLALTSYESLSMGVPVVSANVGGQSELIDNTVGDIIPYSKELAEDENKEIELYVSSVQKCLNNLDKLKKNARNKIVNKFTLDQMVNHFEKVFDSLEEKEIFVPKKIAAETYRLFLVNTYDEYAWMSNDYCINHYAEFTTMYGRGYRFREHMWKHSWWRRLTRTKLWNFLKKFKEKK